MEALHSEPPLQKQSAEETTTPPTNSSRIRIDPPQSLLLKEPSLPYLSHRLCGGQQPTITEACNLLQVGGTARSAIEVRIFSQCCLPRPPQPVPAENAPFASLLTSAFIVSRRGRQETQTLTLPSTSSVFLENNCANTRFLAHQRLQPRRASFFAAGSSSGVVTPSHTITTDAAESSVGLRKA